MTDDILEPNPFANPILATEGDSNASAIYQKVGVALDRWERCEVSFAVLYSALILANADNHVLLRAFGSVIASNTKREMIWHANDAFFESWMNGDFAEQAANLKKQTRKLLNLYGKAAARRNEIAHSQVNGELRHKVVNQKAVMLPTIWFLVPPLFATRKTELFHHGPKYRYSTRELSHFTACFEELSSRASQLTQQIREFRASLPQKR